MRAWSITLHGSAGLIGTVDARESQFVIGTETAADVFTVTGEGVTARHAWVWINEGALQVEDLGGGTVVNGYHITERVQVEYPASVQVGEITLVIEVKAAEPELAAHVPPIPSSMNVTIPQRTPIRSSVNRVTEAARPFVQSSSTDKASTLCEYTLVREIARGGMGQIYFGEDPQLERQVAVKVSSISEDGEDPRFSKEAKVLAQLAHPNIVPIHNIGVDAQGRPFYSMKLVKGRTLQAVLNLIRDGDAAATKEYPRATLLTIFRKVCDAMMFAHSKGILHRDLKPENIMVGEYGEVLVMDWGLAKVLGEREENVSAISKVNDTGDYGMTMEGEVMGTPQYMSPEQAEGMVAELDARSDIYSLGGILYAILTLRPPIEGTSLDEVLTKVRNGSISSMVTKRGGKGGVTVGAPPAMGAEVPEALQAVTLKAMARARTKRYASVEAFAADIEAYQNGFATSAEDAGAVRQLVLFIKRNKGVSAAVALFLIAAAIFTLKLAASERTARENERQAVAQTEKSRRAAAQAQISLAEAAEAASDSGAMRNALDAVPEDLRTPDWNYFQSRIETATFSIEAPKGMSWVGFDDWPSEPEQMVAMRSDGEVCAVDLNTGTLQSLWKFNPNGIKSRGSIGVSQNGKLIALNYVNQTGAAAVEICNLENGEQIGGFQQPGAIFYNYKSTVTLSDTICLFRGEFGKDRERRLEVWDWREGKHLWELSGVTFAEFDADQKNVLLIANDEIQRREALSGTVVSTGSRVGATHSNYPWNIAVYSDWNNLFIPFGNYKMRRLNPWKNEMYLEITPSYGNFASTIMGDFLATVGRVSPTTGVLEIRLSDGSGTRTFPFLAPVLTEERAPKIRAKANALAIRFPNVLKIWRFEQAKPRVFETGGGRNARLGSTSYSLSLQTTSGVRTAVRLIDSAVKDPKKQTVWERTFPTTLYYVTATREGEHCLLGFGSQIGAFRVGKTGLEEIWPSKNVSHVGDVWAVHPMDRRIWTGKAVLEFSSGRQLVEVKDRRGFVTADSNVWVGSDRVAEIAYLEAAGSDEGDTAGGAVQLALWNAESGELAKSIKAANATWICVSPDALHLAEAGADKRLRIRNAQTLEVEQEFRCHEAALTGVAWHPTLPLLVTQARDGMIRVWNLKTFEKVEEFTSKPHGASRHEDKYMDRLEITADGRELNVYRSGNKFFVFRPECFQGQK